MHFKFCLLFFLFATELVAYAQSDWTNLWEGLKTKFSGSNGISQQNSFGQPPNNGQGQFGQNVNGPMNGGGQNPYDQSLQMPPKTEGAGGFFSSLGRKLMNFLAKGGKEDKF
uniref:Uncharacterized protein n=1 Tax=Globodera rostochiensis TaxID=31243 RepID=A0A914GQQ4_GLORO